MRQQRVTSGPNRARVCLVLLLSALVLVSGCGADDPRPVETPRIRWAGDEPSGDIEADPWVRAARAAELARVTALNSANFTDPALLATWREELVQRFAEIAARSLDDGTGYVVLGPTSFAPLVVEVEPSGERAVVRGCTDKWATDPEFEQGPGPWPQAHEYRLELGADGQRRITGSSELREPTTLPDGADLTDEYCAGVEVPHGTFDPPPDLESLQELRGSDVVAPPRPSPTFPSRVSR